MFCLFPLEAFLRRLLMVNDNEPGYIARFKTSTFKDFTNRIEGIDALSTLQMAVALDSRYKKLTFLRRAKREAVTLNRSPQLTNQMQYAVQSPS